MNAKNRRAASDDLASRFRLLLSLACLLLLLGAAKAADEPANRGGDIDWDRARMHIHSPKKEHLDCGGDRWVPIFPELRPYLEQSFDQAAPGTIYVINRHRDSNANLRTQLMRIIRRAGLKPWPKLFHNLRATLETELAAQYPIHVVCAWIGHTQLIAAKHYLQVTDEDFERATKGMRVPPS